MGILRISRSTSKVTHLHNHLNKATTLRISPNTARHISKASPRLVTNLSEEATARSEGTTSMVRQTGDFLRRAQRSRLHLQRRHEAEGHISVICLGRQQLEAEVVKRQ